MLGQLLASWYKIRGVWVEFLLSEIEAESQMIVAGDKLQSSMASKGACTRLCIRACPTLIG